MTRSTERIVANYLILKNRKALENIRDHRRKLLSEAQMLCTSSSAFRYLNAELEDEIGLVDAALNEMPDVRDIPS